MSDIATSLIQEKKFIQCEYHIKSSVGEGHWRCQGSVDHEPGKHVLPKSSPPHGIVDVVGQWYPTFEEAHRAHKEK